MIAGLVDVTVRRFDRAVLDEVSLSIEEGERVALVGPNGAGKTTLLRLLVGLDVPPTGAAAVGRGGYVPQRYSESLFPWFSVLRNIALPRLAVRDPGALEGARRLARELLPDVDPGRAAGRLSGGEQQAVAIARALCAPGDIVVADEPFSALSTTVHRRAVEVLDRALAGRALVLVTHDPDDARALCSRVIEIREGQLIEILASRVQHG